MIAWAACAAVALLLVHGVQMMRRRCTVCSPGGSAECKELPLDVVAVHCAL